VCPTCGCKSANINNVVEKLRALAADVAALKLDGEPTPAEPSWLAHPRYDALRVAILQARDLLGMQEDA
jgi:hypothetical protein